MQTDRINRNFGVRQAGIADENVKREWSESEKKAPQRQDPREALNELRQKKNPATARTAQTAVTQKPGQIALRDNAGAAPAIEENLYPIERSGTTGGVRPEAFDMKADMDDFIRPPLLSGKMIEREQLDETAKKIIAVLERKDANPELIKKAVRLFNEERQVKSLLAGYRNSLIFS